jgi:fatty-acyl-CoA synthase
LLIDRLIGSSAILPAMPNTPPLLPRISDYLDHYAAARPNADFLLHEELRLDYAEARERVDACARALLAAGLRRGDRVAVYGTPRPEFFITFLATASLGGLWLGLNPKYTLEELAYNVGDSKPKLLIGLLADQRQAEVLGALAAAEPTVAQVITREPASETRSFAEFLAAGEAIDDDELAAARALAEPDDPAALVYTSGSTGRPKGALLTHRGLAACCVAQYEHWVTFEPLRIVCDLPINHVGALGDICCSTLVAGGALFFMEKFDPSGVLRTIERERISSWLAVPTMLLLATRAPEWKTADLSSLRRIAWSGAPASEALVAELGRLGVTLSTSYGMTETVGSVTYTADDDPVEVLVSTIGRPDPRFEVIVVREDGSECDEDEQGELVVSGDCLMQGYLNRPEATAETIRDGRLHTGDSAVRRADGNIRLVGRLSDMFKSGGYNVYCREVEVALEQHPDVELAAIVPIPDELYGEVGHAFLLTAGGAPVEPDQMREHLRNHLANYKIPKSITTLDEMPRLAIGKVDKKALLDRALSESR